MHSVDTDKFIIGSSHNDYESLEDVVAREESEKIESLTKIANQGGAEAQYKLGACLHDGYFQYFDEAVEWFRKAAKQGHAEAQYSLGLCYEKGEGVPQDKQKARELYISSAKQGNKKAIDKVLLPFSKIPPVPDHLMDYIKTMQTSPSKNPFIVEIPNYDVLYKRHKNSSNVPKYDLIMYLVLFLIGIGSFVAFTISEPGSSSGSSKFQSPTHTVPYTPYSTNPSYPAIQPGNYNSIRNLNIQQPVIIPMTSSPTPEDAYEEGYEEGYEQGEYDGQHGYSEGYGYDNSSDYYDYYEEQYQEGYEEGYYNGHSLGYRQYEEEQEQDYYNDDYDY